MKVGLSAYDITGPDLVALARAADEAGFDTCWLGEHLLLPVEYESVHPSRGAEEHEHISGPIVSPTTELVDPLVALGAVAAVTTRLRPATGIYILPLRHPLATARAAASLHELSGGRFHLGVGVGWLEEEFTSLGIPFEERRGRFTEAISLMRLAWEGGSFQFEGEYYRTGHIQVSQRPVEVPVILGGNGPRALARAAALGDGWFSSGTPDFDDAVALDAELARLRQTHDVDPEQFPRWFRVAGGERARLERYREAGIDKVVVWADQLWPAEGTVDHKRQRFFDRVSELGLDDVLGR